MWSHYANSHNGVALQFSFSNIDESLTSHELGIIDVINYSWELPQVKYLYGDSLDNVKNIIFTKSKRWKYEKEYRILIPNIIDNIRTFPIPLIKVRNIYLGCKVNDNVIDILANNISHLNKIFQLKMEPDEYAYKKVSLRDIIN